ncbi:hypothetical protein AB0L40_24720 [Patulibacter sp. NPDC049589]|uniref:hypothetical protein n=1 Tax=Patulibacter sp. NPDC049589 TaxID=3154731 RepID=UPI003439D112
MHPPPIVPVDVLRRAVQVFRTHFALLYPLALIFGLVQAMVSYALADTAAASLALALQLVSGTLLSGMVVGFVRDVEAGLPAGEEPSVGSLFRTIAPVADKLLLVSLLSAGGIILGLVALIVPGLWLMTIWAVIAPVIVIERVGVQASFGRSRDLVAGNGWPVFGVLLLTILLLLPVGLIAIAIGAGAGDVVGSFISVLFGALAATITVIATATLYFRLLEIEAARASQARPDADAAALGVQPAVDPWGPAPGSGDAAGEDRSGVDDDGADRARDQAAPGAAGADSRFARPGDDAAPADPWPAPAPRGASDDDDRGPTPA